MKQDKCSLGILPYPVEIPGIICKEYIQEHLSICVPVDHALAEYKSVTCEMINGFNCLLSSDIGFWDKLCKKLMPSSRFLVQTDDFTFRELIKESSLPCFTTNLVDQEENVLGNRVILPITNPEVNVTYYIINNKVWQLYNQTEYIFHSSDSGSTFYSKYGVQKTTQTSQSPAIHGLSA